MWGAPNVVLEKATATSNNNSIVILLIIIIITIRGAEGGAREGHREELVDGRA